MGPDEDDVGRRADGLPDRSSGRRKRRNRWIAAAVGARFWRWVCWAGGYLASRGGGCSRPAAAASPPNRSPCSAPTPAPSGRWRSIRTSDTVAMAVEDGSVRLWDWPTKSVKSTINAHRGTSGRRGSRPTARLLATAGDDGLIKLWNRPQPEPIQTFEHPNAVRGLAFAATVRRCIAGDRDGGLRVWSLDAEQPLAEAQQPGAVYAVAISPDDETLATARQRQSRAALERQNADAEAAAGRTLPAGLWPVVQSRRATTGLGRLGQDRAHLGCRQRPARQVWDGHDGDIWGVAYSPDGRSWPPAAPTAP